MQVWSSTRFGRLCVLPTFAAVSPPRRRGVQCCTVGIVGALSVCGVLFFFTSPHVDPRGPARATAGVGLADSVRVKADGAPLALMVLVSMLSAAAGFAAGKMYGRQPALAQQAPHPNHPAVGAGGDGAARSVNFLELRRRRRTECTLSASPGCHVHARASPLLDGAQSILPFKQQLKRRAFSDTPGSVRMRFVHINDVYTLENLPRLRSLLLDCEAGIPRDNLVVSIGGDLLAPYPLSALDKGKGMVDVLLACRVRYVCFGNHEADVGLTALRARIEQWRAGGGVWLNTNMPDLFSDLDLPRHALVRGYSHDESCYRCVGLLGVCTNDPSLYVAPNDFGGAIVGAQGCNKGAIAAAQRLVAGGKPPGAAPTDAALEAASGTDGQDGHCDAVVVLTHQDTDPDRELAECGREFGISVVLGGHDHEEYLEMHNGCVMAKAGQDANKAAVIDIVWRSPTDATPAIDYMDLVPVAEFARSKPVGLLVNRHMNKLWQLEMLKGAMALTVFDPEKPTISSRNVRLQQTTMGTYLCNAVRQELFADCVLFDAGNIRGNRDYVPVEGHHRGTRWAFTMADLELELPWPSPFVTVFMRGCDIAAALEWSRSHIPALFGGFLQADTGVAFQAGENVVTHINGEPLEQERLYRVAVMLASLNGMNSNPAFTAWRHFPSNVVPPADAGKPVKTILLSYFARQEWMNLPSFESMDAAGNGFLSVNDIREGYLEYQRKLYPQVEHTDDVIEAGVARLMSIADVNSDDRVSREEYERLFPLPLWATLATLPAPETSKGVRERSASMAVRLCTGLREELGAEVVLVDGGNIRGDRDYVPKPGHRRGAKWEFTHMDLRRELPWPSEMVTVQMLGAEVEEAISWSRSWLPKLFPGFLQTDDLVRFNEDDPTAITHLAGEVLDRARLYTVGLMHASLTGMNGNPVFKRWGHVNAFPPKGPAAKTLLLRYFTRGIWQSLPDFESLDKDGDGWLCWDDFTEPLRRIFFKANFSGSGKGLGRLLRRLLFMAKLDAQSRVSKEEYERLRDTSRWQNAPACQVEDLVSAHVVC